MPAARTTCIADRGLALSLADAGCAKCGGMGGRGRDASLVMCGCVYRKMFRSCLRTYRQIGSGGLHSPGDFTPQDFRADFESLAARTLDPLAAMLFRLHFIGGKTWRRCCPSLDLDKGEFFHWVYRIEERLGRVYYETATPLYPPGAYLTDARIERRINLLISDRKRARANGRARAAE